MNYYKDAYQKTTSMENIRVVFSFGSHHITRSRLKDASHEPFTFRWGHPGENMSQVGLQGAIFFGTFKFQRFSWWSFVGGKKLATQTGCGFLMGFRGTSLGCQNWKDPSDQSIKILKSCSLMAKRRCSLFQAAFLRMTTASKGKI